MQLHTGLSQYTEFRLRADHREIRLRGTKPSRLFWAEYFWQVFTIVGQLRRPLIGKRGGLFSYFCRHNFIIRRKLWLVLEKPNFYQVMIFIALTLQFWAGSLLFIHYLLFIYCFLDSNHHPSDLKWRKKCKILRGFEPASFKSAFHAATTEL